MTDISPRRGGPDAQAHPGLDRLRAEALAGGRRPRRYGVWYTTEHMLRAMRAYGWTIVVGAVGQPLIYLFGLAVGLAAVIHRSIPVGDGQAVSYLVFVAPALLMTATISVAGEEFTYPVMAGFTWRRYFYGFNASPLSSPQIAGGVTIAASARMAFAAAAYYGFIWAFGAVLHIPTVPDPGTGWIAVPLGLLAGLSFGMPLLAYAAMLREDTGQFALVQRFVLVPMFLFSGTFYPLGVLPVWLQWVGWISPLWHATELGRIATFGEHVDAGLVLVHLGYLIVLSALGFVAARHLFTRRLAE